jgi:deazaflavin-dependent oxidoreductase (nitroreductase family)
MKDQLHILDVIRAFNKHVLNRLTLKFAGSAHSPISVIHHVGRRSGRPYQTPVIVEPLADGFIFALTYGPEVDWYHNILAAGQGVVRWHGKEYAIENPEMIDVKKALPVFPLPLRLILRIMGTCHFFRMKYQSGGHYAQT